jgi:hypothetical protein
MKNLIALSSTECANDLECVELFSKFSLQWTFNPDTNRRIIVIGTEGVYEFMSSLNLVYVVPRFIKDKAFFSSHMELIVEYFTEVIKALWSNYEIANLYEPRLIFYYPDNVKINGFIQKRNGVTTTLTGDSVPFSPVYEYVRKFKFAKNYVLSIPKATQTDTTDFNKTAFPPIQPTTGFGSNPSPFPYYQAPPVAPYTPSSNAFVPFGQQQPSQQNPLSSFSSQQPFQQNPLSSFSSQQPFQQNPLSSFSPQQQPTPLFPNYSFNSKKAF